MIGNFYFLDYLIFLTFLNHDKMHSSMTYPTVENRYSKIMTIIGIYVLWLRDVGKA
jgi:hypothetical protein